MEQTVYYQPQIQKNAALMIIDKKHKPYKVLLRGNMTMGRANSESDRDIRLYSDIVSRRHGEFIFNEAESCYYYVDNNSLNGTFINGAMLEKYDVRGSRPYKLSDGDIIRIDRTDLEQTHPEAVLLIFRTTLSDSEEWKEYKFSQSIIHIGRDSSCELKLDDLTVSRFHSVIARQNDEWYIADNDSTNGVGLNGVEITGSIKLNTYDVIRISNIAMIFLGSSVIYNSSNESDTILSVDIKDKTVSGGKLLLKDIQAEFHSKDFVLILGGSGAGKTTLIKAILGESRANGKIILNGQDLYKNFKNMKSQIGMVPQFLTLRTNDSVRDTLMDTASIKMGKKYSQSERMKRVEEVLEHVGIKEHADKLIGQLSGGQQKKASVANQLIGFQKVFICDEPDSGLDAASRMQQMEILKEISEEGKIVMVISHEPDDAVEIVEGEPRTLFTKVIVLARSSQDRAGHLAYFGNIDGAMDFFGVDRLQDIMLEINPPTEGGRGKADFYIQKYRQLRGGI